MKRLEWKTHLRILSLLKREFTDQSCQKYVDLSQAKNCQVPVKAWVQGVPVEKEAVDQLIAISRLPIVHSHVAAMPDMHLGKGTCVGCVVPTVDAIIPAAVGVVEVWISANASYIVTGRQDIGCGMMAVRTSMLAEHLPDSLGSLRSAIEKAVPHGRTNRGRKGDHGAWKQASIPSAVSRHWKNLEQDYEYICNRQPLARASNTAVHLGTLGTGNHFIEMCVDEESRVWFMLHSGSRGPGNRIGSVYIEIAKNEMLKLDKSLQIDRNLSYLREGTDHFEDYVFAVSWAQRFARTNRELMMSQVLQAAMECRDMPPFTIDPLSTAVNCHHNYVNRETHFGKDVYLTRKGVVSAREGQLGIIPGSMGTRSFIIKGKGNPDAFHSCSHGAGRVMSRSQAKKTFTLQDHSLSTEGVECRKDAGVIDETPLAYKDIDDVMEAQSDLIEIVHTLKQVLCVKG